MGLNTYELATGVALHRLRLTIASIMVRSAAFVARGRAWTTSTTSKPSTETTPVSSPRNWSTAAKAWLNTTVRARALLRRVSQDGSHITRVARVPQDGLAAHKNSNGHQYQLHSGAMSDNQLGRGQVLDSDSIVWLQYEGQHDVPHIVKRACALLLSVVRGCGQPLDSCPRIDQKLFIVVEALLFADGVAYQVACLGTIFSRV